jgi:hypothetical protein
MKITVAALSAVLLTSTFFQTPARAQAPPPAQPYIQIPVPGMPGAAPPPERREERGYDREHCERLRDREHDIRDRLAHAPPYTEERGRLEGQLHEVRDQRERCGDRDRDR